MFSFLQRMTPNDEERGTVSKSQSASRNSKLKVAFYQLPEILLPGQS